MSEDGNDVRTGTYMDPAGNTYKLLCIAEHRTDGRQVATYVPSFAPKAGRFLFEDVEVFVSLLKQGNFKFQGPLPRIVGSNVVSPGVFLDKRV